MPVAAPIRQGRPAHARTAPVVHGRYWVPVGWIKLGMHVADLDRPWLDTPFMLQGFLVQTPRQIEALQQYCTRVIVDVDCSLADARPLVLERGEPVLEEIAGDGPVGPAGRIRPVGTTSEGSDRPHTGPTAASAARRPDAKIAPDERSAPRVRPNAPASPSGGGFWAWLKSLLPGPRVRAREHQASQLPLDLEREIRATLPPQVELQDWRDTRSVESELPRARAALEHGEKVLDRVFDDMHNGRLPEIESVRGAMDMVVASMTENPNAMLWVAHLRQRNALGYQHALRVALYMVALGRKLGFPRDQLVDLGMIGLLADIGKTRIPRELIEKPGLLTPEEFETVKRHVPLGLEMLSKTKALPEAVLEGIAQHHERMDGSGYPNGRSGRDIGVYGRMAGIADCFSALTTDRPYAKATTAHRALMNLFEWSKSAFHGPLVEQFVQSIGLFPVGSLIELSTGEVAVVLAHNRVRRLEPRVLVLTTADKQPLHQPVEMDLLSQHKTDDQPSVFILKGLPPGAYGLSPSDYYADAAVDENVAR